MKSTIVAALSALSLAAGSAGAATNLLADGDFEAFGPVSGYTTVNGGAALGAWTVGGTSIDLIQGAYNAISGVSIDLAGSPGPGSLSQSFTAQAGHSYLLSFDLSNNGGSQMDVTFGGTTTTFTPTSTTTPYSLAWTAAASGLQAVVFDSVQGGNGGPVLDNVVLTVTAVPEPGTYALLLSGLLAVGFVARRRQA